MRKYYRDSLNQIRFSDGNIEIQPDWVELTQEEFEAIINPPKTQEQIEAELIAHFKLLYLNVFNSKLKELQYDGMETLNTWARNSSSPYYTEANSVLDWYEACVLKNIEILNDVKLGIRDVPTDEEYLSELPIYQGGE